METFKIRCSSIGKIMGTSGMITAAQLAEITTLEEKAKLTDKQAEKLEGLKFKRDNPQLSGTAKTYCEEWLKEQLYERRKQISSKYMDKGNICEDDSLDLIAEKMGYGLLLKNEEFFENEFTKGTPDAILPDHLIDVKNSWDFTTFPLFETEVPNDDYYFQGQGYMWLTGRDSYKLIYTLMDTPAHLVEKEFKWNNPLQKSEKDFKKDYLYSSVKSNLRIKCFEFDKNEEDIERIKLHVELCRNYIKELLNIIK